MNYTDGFVNALWDPAVLRDTVSKMRMRLYEADRPPAKAHYAAKGRLLVEVPLAPLTSAITDCTFRGQGEVIQSGRCRYFRIVNAGDSDGVDRTAPRLQGTVGKRRSNQMRLGSNKFYEGSTFTLCHFTIALSP